MDNGKFGFELNEKVGSNSGLTLLVYVLVCVCVCVCPFVFVCVHTYEFEGGHGTAVLVVSANVVKLSDCAMRPCRPRRH